MSEKENTSPGSPFPEEEKKDQDSATSQSPSSEEEEEKDQNRDSATSESPSPNEEKGEDQDDSPDDKEEGAPTKGEYSESSSGESSPSQEGEDEFTPSLPREAKTGSSEGRESKGESLSKRDSSEPKGVTLPSFQVMALVMAFLGLGLVHLRSVYTAVPTIQVGEIKADMNYSFVEIEGEVSRTPFQNWEADGQQIYSISFLVDDGTGTVRVSAYRKVARELWSSGQVPREGDRVTASGHLFVGKYGRPKMYLLAPSHLTVEPQEISPQMLVQLKRRRDLGPYVKVKAYVARVLQAQAKKGQPPLPVRWVIFDATGRGEVFVSPSVFERVQEKLKGRDLVGRTISVVLKVTQSRRKKNLVLERAADFHLVEVDGDDIQPLSALDKNQLHKQVHVMGMVQKMAKGDGGSREIRLLQGQSGVDVIFLPTVIKEGGRLVEVEPGNYLAVRGILKRRGGGLAIFPLSQEDIRILNPGHSWLQMEPQVANRLKEVNLPLERVEVVPLKTVGVVEGVIVKIDPPRPNRAGKMRPGKIYIQGGGLTYPITLWEKDYTRLTMATPLRLKDRIRALVKVGEFREKRELYLQKVALKKVMGGPSKISSPIKGSSGNKQADENRKIPLAKVTEVEIKSKGWVTGVITRVQPPQKSRRSGRWRPGKAWIKQGSHEYPLVMWLKTFNQLRDRLGLGKKVRAHIQVIEYRGKRELKVLGGQVEGVSKSEKPKKTDSNSSSKVVQPPPEYTLAQTESVPLRSTGWVKGTIVRIQPPTMGTRGRYRPGKIYISQGGKEGAVVIWKKRFDQLAAKYNWKIGDPLKALIKVGTFRNRRELYLQGTSLVIPTKVEEKKETPRPGEGDPFAKVPAIPLDKPLSLKEIQRLPLGYVGLVVGKIASITPPKPSPRGRGRPGRILLVQGDFKIPLILWHKAYRRVMEKWNLKVGHVIEGRVEVGEHRGRRELRLQGQELKRKGKKDESSKGAEKKIGLGPKTEVTPVIIEKTPSQGVLFPVPLKVLANSRSHQSGWVSVYVVDVLPPQGKHSYPGVLRVTPAASANRSGWWGRSLYPVVMPHRYFSTLANPPLKVGEKISLQIEIQPGELSYLVWMGGAMRSFGPTKDGTWPLFPFGEKSPFSSPVKEQGDSNKEGTTSPEKTDEKKRETEGGSRDTSEKDKSKLEKSKTSPETRQAGKEGK